MPRKGHRLNKTRPGAGPVQAREALRFPGATLVRRGWRRNRTAGHFGLNGVSARVPHSVGLVTTGMTPCSQYLMVGITAARTNGMNPTGARVHALTNSAVSLAARFMPHMLAATTT